MEKIGSLTVEALGKVILPDAVRKKLSINEKDQVDIFRQGNSIIIDLGTNKLRDDERRRTP